MTSSRIGVKLAYLATLELRIILIIILPCINVCHGHVYVWNSHPCLHRVRNYYAYKRMKRSRVRVKLASPLVGVKNYSNNYLAYKRLKRSRIRLELAHP